MGMRPVGLIWAQSPSGVIGRHGGIPWHLPEDLARFKNLTMGHTVVMGRRTWESLPAKVRPLPGRRNVVLTRQADYMAAGATVVDGLDAALAGSNRDLTWVIGGSEIYIADEYPDFGALSPDSLGGSAVSLHLLVDACDAVAEAAEAAGALLLRRPSDQSYGERTALVQDPWGHRWFIAQPTEQVSPEEMQRRWEDATG